MSGTLDTNQRGPRGPQAVDPAGLFFALADNTRLNLLKRLCAHRSGLSVTQLTEGTAITRQAVTKHLAVLQAAGLIADRRAGRERLWGFSPEGLAAAGGCLKAVIAQWDEAVLRHHKEAA